MSLIKKIKHIQGKVWAAITVLSTIIGLLAVFAPSLFEKEKTIDHFDLNFSERVFSTEFIAFIEKHYEFGKLGSPFQLSGILTQLGLNEHDGTIDYGYSFGGMSEEGVIYIPDTKDERCNQDISRCSKYVLHIDGEHYHRVYRAGAGGYELDGYFRVESIQSYSDWCSKYGICNVDPFLQQDDTVIELKNFDSNSAMLLLK